MFKVGFSRLDITPPFGTPLAGYFTARQVDGVLDPIELNAIAVNDGENTAVIIAADILYFHESAATKLRKLVSEATGVNEEFLYFQGLHQHTSIMMGVKPALSAEDHHSYIKDEHYLDIFNRRMIDVTKMAIADMSEATVGVAEGETAEEISFIRRFLLNDGTTATNPGRRRNMVVRPLGDSDNTVRLIRFNREGKNDIALVNFSTHPDTIGGTKISADWPGFVRRYTEKALDGVSCILLNGAQGDTNHVNIKSEEVQSGYHRAEHMGRVITDTVLKLWDNTTPKKAGKITSSVEMIYIPTNTTYIDEIDRFKKLDEDVKAGVVEAPDMAGRAEIIRVLRLPSETLFQKVAVSVLGVGELAFVGFGGEPFTQYAEAARNSAPDLYVITTCCTNGGAGYLPTTEAYAEGGYEARSSNFSPIVAKTLQSSVDKKLKTHQKNLCN